MPPAAVASAGRLAAYVLATSVDVPQVRLPRRSGRAPGFGSAAYGVPPARLDLARASFLTCALAASRLSPAFCLSSGSETIFACPAFHSAKSSSTSALGGYKGWSWSWSSDERIRTSLFSQEPWCRLSAVSCALPEPGRGGGGELPGGGGRARRAACACGRPAPRTPRCAPHRARACADRTAPATARSANSRLRRAGAPTNHRAPTRARRGHGAVRAGNA